ncbi:unnamed protein product [Acanthosepion pharaonis]|uniref:CS domain-containing protein n=1 Tax=Acanthosepion pharaonis TaxID=158019 RepID=A0A812CWB1_ACAPH|nr:unnamed protein product [Sepia pharaonis]
MDGTYDNALMGILQQEGQLGPFLDVIMGFLYRRTDFYHILRDKSDTKGFHPGMALNILLKSYRKFEDKARNNENSSNPKLLIASKANQYHEEMTDVDSKSPNICDAETCREKPKFPEKEKVASKTTSEEENNSTDSQANTINQGPPSKTYQADSESYNGAEREGYSWSQSITDCDLRVQVPKNLVKGKQIKVDIKKKHLKVSYRADNGEEIIFIDDDLMWEVQKDDCMWSLIPGEHIHLYLEKVQERWWDAVFINEPKINVREIDCSRPMSDLKEDEQMKIQELMYNERQKRLGLPQSHEEKAHNLLKQAWDAEGSPFKGQTFDTSKLKVDPSGVLNINP